MVIADDKLNSLNQNSGVKKTSLKRSFSSQVSCENTFSRASCSDLFNGRPSITAALLSTCELQEMKLKSKINEYNTNENYVTLYSPAKLTKGITLSRDVKNLEISRSFTKQGSPALSKSSIRSVKGTKEKTAPRSESPVIRRIKKVKTLQRHSRSPSCGNNKPVDTKEDSFTRDADVGSPLRHTPSKRLSLSTWIKRRSSHGISSFSKDADKRRQSLSSLGNGIKTADQFFNSPIFKNNLSSKIEPHLVDVINHKVGRRLFHDFLKREYSAENLEFWIECENFKSLTPTKQVKQAAKIYQRFVETNAAMEVNLDAPTRTFLSVDIAYPSSDMFNEAQRQIYKLMQRDSFPRFIEYVRQRKS